VKHDFNPKGLIFHRRSPWRKWHAVAPPALPHATKMAVNGYVAMTASITDLKPHKFDRYAPGESDVCFDIAYCGICHTVFSPLGSVQDVHFIKNDLGVSQYPATSWLARSRKLVARWRNWKRAISSVRVSPPAPAGSPPAPPLTPLCRGICCASIVCKRFQCDTLAKTAAVACRSKRMPFFWVLLWTRTALSFPWQLLPKMGQSWALFPLYYYIGPFSHCVFVQVWDAWWVDLDSKGWRVRFVCSRPEHLSRQWLWSPLLQTGRRPGARLWETRKLVAPWGASVTNEWKSAGSPGVPANKTEHLCSESICVSTW